MISTFAVYCTNLNIYSFGVYYIMCAKELLACSSKPSLQSFIKQGATQRLPHEFSAIITTLSIINMNFLHDIAADANRVC